MSPATRAAAELLPLTPAAFQVLLALVDGPKHGYAVMKEVEARTDGRVRLSTGTLYGIVKRLLADGVIREFADTGERGRRTYRLTPFGRRVAVAEADRLRELVASTLFQKLLADPA
jgi:DNA-binding PadR family transcriptional regulator